MTDESTELPSGATPQEGQADVGVRQEGRASQNERREILTKRIVAELRTYDTNRQLPNIMNRNIEHFGWLPGEGENDNAFLEWKTNTRDETYTRVGEALAAYWDKTFPDDTALALADPNLRYRIRWWLKFFLSNETQNPSLLPRSEYFRQLILEGVREHGENPFFPTAVAFFALGDGLRTVISLRAALKAEGVETVGGVPIDNLTLAEILAGINEGPIKRNLELCLKVISEMRAAHPDMERVIVGAWITDPSGEKEPVTSLDTTLKQEGLVWNEEKKRYVPKPPTPSH
jgi:hypothetical protein